MNPIMFDDGSAAQAGIDPNAVLVADPATAAAGHYDATVEAADPKSHHGGREGGERHKARDPPDNQTAKSQVAQCKSNDTKKRKGFSWLIW
jgi:hypothetical protein